MCDQECYCIDNCIYCGCRDCCRVSKDEYGYIHKYCEVCQGAKSLDELAKRLDTKAVLINYYQSGIEKQQELTDLYIDILNDDYPYEGIEDVAKELVDYLYDDIVLDAEVEMVEAADFYETKLSAYVDAQAGRW